MSVAEYLALGAAIEQGASNQKSIAQRAGLDAMSVSRAMASLEDRSLLRRTVQADSRNWEVTVTSKARTLLRAADKSAASAFGEMLAAQDNSSVAAIRKLFKR